MTILTRTLPRRGRGPARTSKALGVLCPDGTIDTSSLRGLPVVEILSAGQAEGFDPSQMAAEGYNVMAARLARVAAPSQQERLIQQRLAKTPTEARLVDLHAGRIAKITGVAKERALAWLASAVAPAGA